MSERSQKAVVWWALAFFVVYALAFGFLLRMVPLTMPRLTAEETATFYRERESLIKAGAMICSWTGAFMLPLSAVLTVQVRRVEGGLGVWTVLTALGGAMMSLFLVLPPLFWGVAAYSVNRAPELTLLMHELANLTMTTTDQFYVFEWVAIGVICFLPGTAAVPNTIFSRGYGYFTFWTCVMFEAGAFAFFPRSGAFAWDGLFVFWSPLVLFCSWILVTATLLLRALGRQERAAAAGAGEEFLEPTASAAPAPAAGS